MTEPTNAVLRLTVVNPVDEGNPFMDPQEFTFEGYAAQEIYIGRAPGNSVVLENPAVSGQHLRIYNQGNDFILHDLGSRNGTYLNETRMEPNEQKLLRDGDRIRIVNYVIQIHTGVSAYQPQLSENTRQIALDMIKNVLGGASGHEESPPKLMVMSGPQQGASVDIADVYVEIKIGRSPHCEFPIQDESISREHALIRRDWTGVFIRDLNSRNGVIINGQRLPRGDEMQLKDRDEIVLGTVKLSFSDPEAARIGDQISDVVDDGILSSSTPAPASSSHREPIAKPSIPHPILDNVEEKSEETPESQDPAETPSPEAPDESSEESPEPENESDENAEESEQNNEEALEATDGLTSGQKILIGIVIGVGVFLILLLILLLI